MTRVDVIVTEMIGESRSVAQRLIAESCVTVNGSPVLKSTKLEQGDVIVVTELPEVPVPVPPTVPLLYQDEHLVVVEKPAGLVVHDGAGVRTATLVAALQTQNVRLAPGDDPVRPGIVHRLDRDTSGVLVVASTPVAMERLKAAFAVHDLTREYWVMVEGTLDPPSATIDAPIVRSKSNRTTFTTGDGGRRAVTHYDTLDTHPGVTEATVQLETGRTHQVRVHFRAVGRPVAGDANYGASPALTEALGLTRHALHAQRLAFDHPVTGKPLQFTASLPADLAAARTAAINGAASGS